MWITEQLIESFDILSMIPEDYHAFFTISSTVIFISIILLIFFIGLSILSYVWISIELIKIFKNNDKKYYRVLTYVPIVNLFGIGYLSNIEKRNENHIAYFALLTTLIVALIFGYKILFDIILISMLVHFLDSVRNIVKKYELGNYYFYTFCLSPLSLPIILKKVKEKEENK